eukprot:15446380-Alexandrium_andersonii.AAC.1
MTHVRSLRAEPRRGDRVRWWWRRRWLRGFGVPRGACRHGSIVASASRQHRAKLGSASCGIGRGGGRGSSSCSTSSRLHQARLEGEHVLPLSRQLDAEARPRGVGLIEGLPVPVGLFSARQLRSGGSSDPERNEANTALRLEPLISLVLRGAT